MAKNSKSDVAVGSRHKLNLLPVLILINCLRLDFWVSMRACRAYCKKFCVHLGKKQSCDVSRSL